MTVKFRLPNILSLLLLVCLIGSGFTVSTAASPELASHVTSPTPRPSGGDHSALPAGFQIVSSSATSLTLELQAPPINFEPLISQGETCQRVKMDGYIQNAAPGAPGLLSAGVLIGIPLTATPELIIRSIETVDHPERVHICPVATPILQDDPVGLAHSRGDVLQENSPLYSTDSYLPIQPVELVVSGMIRSQRVARLSFSPIQYNPVRDELRTVRHITVEVVFGIPEAVTDHPVHVNEGAFEQVLQKVLINYSQARSWRLSPQSTEIRTTALEISSAMNAPSYKILVDRDGIYNATYAALQSAGVPVDNIDPRSLRLFNQQVEIPIFVFGEDDGVFTPSDYLLFYGQKIDSKFTDTNVYWLYWEGDPGIRMAIQDGSVHEAGVPLPFRATMHLEENRGYINRSPSGPGNDHWYWTLLNAYQAPIWRDFTFSLQNLPASASQATLRGLLKGYYADPEHHTRIYINNQPLDDHAWPSTAEYSFAIDFPSEYLNEGTNTISIELPFDGGTTLDQVLVNWFEVDYDHSYTAENNLVDFALPGQWTFEISGFITGDIDIFETTDPHAPIRILGGSISPVDSLFRVSFEQAFSGEHRYLALSPSSWLTPTQITQDIPSDLKNNTNGADYLIISHADFSDAVLPLAAYHSSHGQRVAVVDVQDIYDEFNAGVFDPQAIQEFISYAYSNWIPPSPSYVILVGDGHYDFHDYLGGSGPNYIPPFLGEFDPWIGETASDNRFVTISGDDILPDLFIGRLPVNTITETMSVVNKILSYSAGPADQDWNKSLTFVADDADGAGDFPALSDMIVDEYIPEEYDIDKIYYGSEPYTSPDLTQEAIIGAINGGSLVVYYNGHGSTQNWASENLFSIDDIANIVNIGQYPLFTPMTCVEGYFIFPKVPRYNYPSLAESLVVANEKGAIASWSPSGFGLSNGHELLARGLYQAIFADGLRQLGQAATLAKFYLAANGPAYQDLIDTYNLFGDPGVVLKTPPALTLRLPLIIR